MAEIDGIQGCKWNANHVTVFYSVILQHVWLVTGAKMICSRIDDQLDSWNSGAFDELVF